MGSDTREVASSRQPVQTAIGSLLAGARTAGATPERPSAQGTTTLYPLSPPVQPRPGATGELGGALEASGAVRHAAARDAFMAVVAHKFLSDDAIICFAGTSALSGSR